MNDRSGGTKRGMNEWLKQIITIAVAVGVVFLAQLLIGRRERVVRRQELANRLKGHRLYLVYCWQRFYSTRIRKDYATYMYRSNPTPEHLMFLQQELEREPDDEYRAVSARKEVVELIASVKMLFTENKAIARLADTNVCYYYKPVYDYKSYQELAPTARAAYGSAQRWLEVHDSSSAVYVTAYFDPVGVLIGIVQDEAKGGRLEPLIVHDSLCPRCKSADTRRMQPCCWRIWHAAAASDSVRYRCGFCGREFIRVDTSIHR